MKKFWMIVGAVVVVPISFYYVSHHLIMDHLIVYETPKESDVIIVPEGEITEERANRAVQLLQDGYSRSDKIIASPLDAINEQYYLGAGAHEDQLINESEATTTYENAVNTLALMDKEGYDSAIVTTSDYHMLRTKMVYDRVNKQYDFDLTYVAAYHEVGGELVTWQEAPDYIQNFAEAEYWKYWGYLFGLYHFIKPDY